MISKSKNCVFSVALKLLSATKINVLCPFDSDGPKLTPSILPIYIPKSSILNKSVLLIGIKPFSCFKEETEIIFEAFKTLPIYTLILQSVRPKE